MIMQGLSTQSPKRRELPPKVVGLDNFVAMQQQISAL
jgi:hypothetical protein